jgi:hypothetical protein
MLDRVAEPTGVIPLLPALSPRVDATEYPEGPKEPVATYDPRTQLTFPAYTQPEILLKGPTTGTYSNEATNTWFGRDWQVDWVIDDSED